MKKKKVAAVSAAPHSAGHQLRAQFLGPGLGLTVYGKGSDVIDAVRVSPSTFKGVHAVPGQRVVVVCSGDSDVSPPINAPTARIGVLHPSNDLEVHKVQLPTAWIAAYKTQSSYPKATLFPLPGTLRSVASITFALPDGSPACTGFTPLLKSVLLGRVFPSTEYTTTISVGVLGRTREIEVTVESDKTSGARYCSTETKVEEKVMSTNIDLNSKTLFTDGVSAVSVGLPGAVSDLIDTICRTFSGSSPQSLGVLLYGVRGVGKTYTARSIAKATGWETLTLRDGCADSSAPSSERIAEVLTGCIKTAGTPLCVVIDELPSFVKPDATASESALLLQSALENVLESSPARSVLVLCVADSPFSLGKSLRRVGRIGCECELSAPGNAAERSALFGAILREKGWPKEEVESIKEAVVEVGEITHGFVAADLLGVAAAAELGCVNGPITAEAVLQAAKTTRPASLKTHEVSVPTVRWDDVGGQEEAKQVLAECVEWPLTHATLFKALDLRPPSGVLLYGPPGCSKTLLAKALATECHYNFIAVKGPELYNKWVGESEKAVRDVFAKARAAAPTILFFDELDGMCGKRGGGGVTDRVISQFLTEMDGMPGRSAATTGQVIVLAATNRPDNIDAAMLRPGRIDRKVYVGLPDLATREQICQIALRGIPLAANVCLHKLATALEGRSGAEVVSAAKEGVLTCVARNNAATAVDMRDLARAAQKVLPRTNQDDLEFYSKWGSGK